MTVDLSTIFSDLVYRFTRSARLGSVGAILAVAALVPLGWSNTVQAAIVSFSSADSDLDYTHTSITRTSSGRTFTFAGGAAGGGLGIDNTFTTDGLYAYEGTAGGNDIKLTISIQSGYTFDISQFDVGVNTGSLTIALTYGDDSTTTFTQTGLNMASFGTLSSFSTPINDVKQVVLTSADFGLFQNFSITDVKPYIVVAPASLPAATVGSAYSQTISASGGAAPYTFAVTAGALPAGLTLASNGTLSGTPTAGGTFNFTVTATDNNTDTGSRAYSLTVNAPTITITPNFPPNFTVGSSYSQTFTANGGTATYTYAITAGALPAGTTLSSGGVLSGTPTAGGTFNFTITATDSSTGTGPYTGSHAYTLLASAPTITVSPASLSAATVGSAYSQTISASGGTSSYTFAVTAGALPAGLTLASDGTLSGTPTAGGTFNFTVTATDSSTGTGPFTGSRAYSLTVNAPTITITPNFPPNFTVGSAYSQTFTASGGTATYTYAITAGALPAGTTLSSGGVLSGTPTAGGTFNFTITATDSSTGTGPYTGSHAYTLLASAPTITVSPASLSAATVGSAYSQTISASGGTSSYTFAVTAGALPAGLTLASDGTLSGTPTAGGTFNFTVTATDSSTGTGPFTGSRAYSLTVNAPTITVSPTSLPDATVAISYSQTITASGGTASYTFAVTAGALPVGLTLASDGTLSGTPTAEGTFNFTVTATDSSTGTGPFTGSRAYSITVMANPPVVTTSGGTTSWIESNNLTVTSTPVAIDGGITITDPESPTLSTGTVSITGGFQSSEDVLAFTNDGSTMGDIAASYIAGTGVLTLTSSGATVAQWQAALRAITYNNTTQPPTGASRTISFLVNDGIHDSSVATKSINLTTVNHPPIFTLGSDPSWPAGTHGLKVAASFTNVSSFGQSSESGQAVSAYHVTDSSDPQGVIDGGSSGILIQADGTLVYSLSGQSGTATISVTLQDDGGTSNGGNDTSAAQIFHITVADGWNLSISMDDSTDGNHFFSGGDFVDYVITVENIGTSDVHDATVQDTLPTELSSVSWTCITVGASTCTASGTGDINDTVSIPANGGLIYHVMAVAQADPETTITNTATVTTSVFEPDSNLTNNTATSVNDVGIYRDGFE